jgi:hypothetical protein
LGPMPVTAYPLRIVPVNGRGILAKSRNLSRHVCGLTLAESCAGQKAVVAK